VLRALRGQAEKAPPHEVREACAGGDSQSDGALFGPITG
jgi:hypothetical protein